MSQTAYQQDPNVAIEGMLADLGPHDLRTAIDQVTDQVLGDLGVLGRPRPNAQHDFLPIYRESKGYDDRVITELDAVDHDRQ